MSENNVIPAASYECAKCCGAECYFFPGNEEQPCWGTCLVIDEIWTPDDPMNPENGDWVHFCKGHKSVWEGKPYVPEALEQSTNLTSPPNSISKER